MSLLKLQCQNSQLKYEYIGVDNLVVWRQPYHQINPLNPELNSICYLVALLGAYHFLHISRIRVRSLIFRLLMAYTYIWSTHS